MVHPAKSACANAGEVSERAEEENAEGDSSNKSPADLMQPGFKKSRNPSAFKACQAALPTSKAGFAVYIPKATSARRIVYEVKHPYMQADEEKTDLIADRCDAQHPAVRSVGELNSPSFCMPYGKWNHAIVLLLGCSRMRCCTAWEAEPMRPIGSLFLLSLALPSWQCTVLRAVQLCRIWEAGRAGSEAVQGEGVPAEGIQGGPYPGQGGLASN